MTGDAEQVVGHPAKYSNRFIPLFAELLKGTANVLDPFAGTGKLGYIHEFGYTGKVYCNELEPEWCAQAPYGVTVTVGDAESLPYPDDFFDAICTSPTFGNRMSDHHNAKDSSRRNTYTHTLGRPLSPGNTGQMQWGQAHRDKHTRVYIECRRVLKPGGLFILNMSDHIRKGAVVPVTQWHVDCLTGLGFVVTEHRRIQTPRNRYGANGRVRVDHESIVVFRKTSA